MAGKLRVQFEGAIYHISIRGVDRREIFTDDHDREHFCERLGQDVEDCAIRLYLFCLMPNHIHLLAETPLANLSEFMHKLQTAYTVYYNRRYHRAGHLMQGRFSAKLVEGNEYLLKLSRYIHLNPIYVSSLREQPFKVRLSRLRSYVWSSYRGYVGLEKPRCFIDEEPILSMMETTKNKQRNAYRRFVESAAAETDEDFLKVLKNSAWGLGGSEFQQRIRDLHTDLCNKATRQEDVAFRRVCKTLSSDKVLSVVAETFKIKVSDLKVRRYDCIARAVAAQMLIKYAAMTQRDAAQFLNVSTGAAICRQLKRLRERMLVDSDLNQEIERIESTFTRLRAV
jgi:putative transposase